MREPPNRSFTLLPIRTAQPPESRSSAPVTKAFNSGSCKRRGQISSVAKDPPAEEREGLRKNEEKRTKNAVRRWNVIVYCFKEPEAIQLKAARIGDPRPHSHLGSTQEQSILAIRPNPVAYRFFLICVSQTALPQNLQIASASTLQPEHFIECLRAFSAPRAFKITVVRQAENPILPPWSPQASRIRQICPD